MAWPREDLLNAVERKEFQEYEKNRRMVTQLRDISGLLEDIYAIQRPNSLDYDNRIDLIRIFDVIATEALGTVKRCRPSVEVFGSFLMGIFSPKSDLDLSIKLNDGAVDCPRERKIKILKKFASRLYSLQGRGIVRNVLPVLHAVVPVLKVTDCGTGIECDLSVENRDGVTNSQIISMVSAIDERFPKLCFLMKAWAKANDINSSKEHTLNSLALISFTAFHLQKRDPAILPPISAILKDGTDPAAVKKNISDFMNSRRTNYESLAELFVTLLIKLASARILWPEGLCMSIYEGSWIYKTWKGKVGCISVEDFTIRSQNVARAVTPAGLIKVYDCIDASLNQIRAFLVGKVELSTLGSLLFGPDDRLVARPSLALKPCLYNYEKHRSHSPMPMQDKQEGTQERKRSRRTFSELSSGYPKNKLFRTHNVLEGPGLSIKDHGHAAPPTVTFPIPWNDPLTSVPSNLPGRLQNVLAPISGSRAPLSFGSFRGGLDVPHNQYFGAQVPDVGALTGQKALFRQPIHRPVGATSNHHNHW